MRELIFDVCNPLKTLFKNHLSLLNNKIFMLFKNFDYGKETCNLTYWIGDVGLFPWNKMQLGDTSLFWIL